MVKQAHKQEVKKLVKEQRAFERTRAQRRKLLARVGLYAIISGVVLVSAYWSYGKLTEKVSWRNVPILPSPHISLGDPHPHYNSDPPTSGPHTAAKARWGVHAEPIAKEMQLHNLEDGGVAINYRCEDCPELVAQLTAIANRYDRVVMAPYSGMEGKITLTAWGKIDNLDKFDEARVVSFIKAHIGIDHHTSR